MLLILTFAAITGFVFAADPAQAVRTSSDAWRQAVIKQDEAGLRRLLADDLIYAHANGMTQDKAEYIAAVTKGPSRYESFTDSDTVIRIYGTAAMLTGLVDVKLAGREKYRVRTLEVYVLNGGQWQMAGHQSARINPVK